MAIYATWVWDDGYGRSVTGSGGFESAFVTI